MTVPYQESYPAYYSVMNYESNALDSRKELLQKVEIYKSEKSWVVGVSEFMIEIDNFFQFCPDDQSKCVRKLKFISMDNDNKLALEYTSEGVSSKKEFHLQPEHYYQNFKNLPDRKISEEKVRRIFYEFHREQWGIYDGILSQELSRVENGVEMWKPAEVSRSKQDESDEPQSNLGGERVTEISINEEKLLTEDELWENRDFLYSS